MRLLLQAGSDPALKNRQRQTALDCLREELFPKPAAIAVLEQVPDAEKTSILVKAGRLVSAATSTTMAPSDLQSRVARGKPLPRLLLRRMVLTPVTGGHDEDDEEDEGHKLRVLVAFILGVGGPEGKGMPRDVFRLVLNLLMPTWDPLRRGVVGMEMSLIDHKER